MTIKKGDWVEIGELYQERFAKENTEFHKYFLSKLATKRVKVKFTRVAATRVSIQIHSTTAMIDFFDPTMKQMKINNHKVDLDGVMTYSDLEERIAKAFSTKKKSIMQIVFSSFVAEANAMDISTLLLMVPLVTALMGGGPSMTLMSMALPAFALMMKAQQPYGYTGAYNGGTGPGYTGGGLFGSR